MRKIRDINNNLIFFIDIPLKLNINDISININIATIQVLLWTRTAQYTERKEPIRNKNFRNTIVEGSLMFEYNFFSINDDQEFAQSPYLFFGVGAFSSKGKEYDYNETESQII